MTEIERLREALTPRQAELLAHLREHKTDHPGSWYLFVNGGFKPEDARALHGAGLVDYSEQMGMPALRLRDRDEGLREALLRCPFCGGEACFEAVTRPESLGAGTRWTVGCNETNEDADGGVFEILCYGYQSLTTFATQREAAAAWNRRAALAAAPPGAERWMPIESAPRDGTLVDLSINYSMSGLRRRATDCLFSESGNWVRDEDGEQLEWGPDEYGQTAVATHWREPPAPPSPAARKK